MSEIEKIRIKDEDYNLSDSLARERINNIIVSGTPTEGNAELIDIRVKIDGTSSPTAGDAVRQQVDEMLVVNKTETGVTRLKVETTAEEIEFVAQEEIDSLIVTDEEDIEEVTQMVVQADGNEYEFVTADEFNELAETIENHGGKVEFIYDGTTIKKMVKL